METNLPPTSPGVPAVLERTHHKFGPSRMEYLKDCAAFSNQVRETTEPSEQGDFLHDIMKEILLQVKAEHAKTCMEQLSNWVFPNNELTEEEQGYIRFCCRKVDKILEQHPFVILVEHPITVYRSDGTELNHGFLDVLFLFANGGAILLDYKFGYIPVPHANCNMQGLNYSVGVLQNISEVSAIGLAFLQPKLGQITEARLERAYLPGYLKELEDVIGKAEFVQDRPAEAQPFMKAGPYCNYCQLSGTCTVLGNHRAAFGAGYNGLPMPSTFRGLAVTTPQDMALLRYWVDVIETGIEEVKKAAFDMAEAQGGKLSCVLPNGDEVVYEIQERNADRSLGDTVEIAEALKDFVTFEQLLAASDLALGKLKPIVETGMQEVARAAGQKLTKKEAWQRTTDALEALGLLTRPDKKIRFLKLQKQQKQIKE